MNIWNIKKYQRIFTELYLNDEKNLENTLQILKKNGASQTDCVKVLIFELNLSLKEADEIVLNSRAWLESKENTERLRDEFGDFIED